MNYGIKIAGKVNTLDISDTMLDTCTLKKVYTTETSLAIWAK